MAGSASPIRYFDGPDPIALNEPTALVAFGGWVDAGSGGTGAVRYLVDALNARKVADLDPEEFYSFTDTRPLTSVVGPGQRAIHWPRGEFYAGSIPGGGVSKDVLLFVAPEPNLKWRTFVNVVLDTLQRFGATTVVSLGSVFGAVHHRGEVPLMGWATEAPLRTALLRRKVTFTNYEGPTGIVTALHAEAQARAIPSAAIIGFTPNYVQGVPNPRTSHALLRAVEDVLDLALPLADLERAGGVLAKQVDRLLTDQPDLRERVERMLNLMNVTESGAEDEGNIRSNPDAPSEPTGELPNPQAVVRELEEFLKQLRTGEPEEPSDGDGEPDRGPSST